MINTLFVMMTLLDGSRVDFEYPDKMKYVECTQYAYKEAEHWKSIDTSNFKSIDIFCGTHEQFLKRHPVDYSKKYFTSKNGVTKNEKTGEIIDDQR